MHLTIRPAPAKRPAPLWRKIGGIHWLSLGRIRISFCLTAAAIATTAQACPSEPLYNLVGITANGNAYVLDTHMTADDCRTSPLHKTGRYAVTLCERSR